MRKTREIYLFQKIAASMRTTDVWIAALGKHLATQAKRNASRSAVSGKYVSKAAAAANPRETLRERR